MVAFSVLFEKPDDPRRTDGCSMPTYFPDLNLDQLVDPIAKARPDYAVAETYYRPLLTTDEVAYRQEVFTDLGDRDILAAIG